MGTTVFPYVAEGYTTDGFVITNNSTQGATRYYSNIAKWLPQLIWFSGVVARSEKHSLFQEQCYLRDYSSYVDSTVAWENVF